MLASASFDDSSNRFSEVGNQGFISTYVVKQGDTLNDIAELFDVSTKTIVWANPGLVNGQKVKVDSKLVILPVSGVKHVVKKGDTVKSIAKKYKADVDAILSYNDIAEDGLIVGEEIIVPDGEMSVVPASDSKSNSGGIIPQIKKVIQQVAEPVYNGYFLRPIVGGRKTQGLHGACRCGVDLAAPTGTTILAAAEGTVSIARSGGYNSGFGSYIVIDHPNGTQTLYAHLSQVLVSEDQTVTQGQIIGAVGNTGHSTGPHVHFEVHGAANPF